MPDDLATLWNSLLSRNPRRIHDAFAGLQPDEQVAVRTHLRRMAEEPGWHPEQRASALAALKALEAVNPATGTG